MSKQNGLSMLDANQVIQEVHNETEKALDVITANNLVPKRFGKVELEYIESSDGTCREVSAAKYYSDGAYQDQTIILHGDELGSTHKTTVNFYTRTPENLANRYFTIYEVSGPVTVWFNLEGTGSVPDVNNRIIQVDIATGDTEPQLAQKLCDTVDADAAFFSIIQDVMVMMVSRTVGKRKPSKDVNTGFVIKNTQGTEKNRLDGTFFYLNSSSNVDLYYVWYNIASSSINPSIPGRIGIEIAISQGASASAVGTATALAIAQTTKFITNIDENVLSITNKTIGATDIIEDVNCKFLSVVTNKLGADRELVAHLVMTYDVNNDLISVERL